MVLHVLKGHFLRYLVLVLTIFNEKGLFDI